MPIELSIAGLALFGTSKHLQIVSTRICFVRHEFANLLVSEHFGA
jgi:hypothetical protein